MANFEVLWINEEERDCEDVNEILKSKPCNSSTKETFVQEKDLLNENQNTKKRKWNDEYGENKIPKLEEWSEKESINTQQNEDVNGEGEYYEKSKEQRNGMTRKITNDDLQQGNKNPFKISSEKAAKEAFPDVTLKQVLYGCNQCGFRTKTEDDFVFHCVQNHEKDADAVPEMLEIGDRLGCDVCDRTFERLQGLEKHQMRAHGMRFCEFKGPLACGFATASAHLLADHHSKTHHDVKDGRVPCGICKLPLRIRSLGIHFKMVHGSKAMLCDKCGFETRRPAEFRRHKIGKHKGMRGKSVDSERKSGCS